MTKNERIKKIKAAKNYTALKPFIKKDDLEAFKSLLLEDAKAELLAHEALEKPPTIKKKK